MSRGRNSERSVLFQHGNKIYLNISKRNKISTTGNNNKKMLNRMIKTRVIAISNGFNAHSKRMNARPMCFMLLFKYHILYDGPWETVLDTNQSKPCSVCKRWCEFSVKCIHTKKNTKQLIDIEWFLNSFATRNEHHLMCWIIKDVFDTILTLSGCWSREHHKKPH